MNEEKIVKWFYDYEELLLEIMDKKPYQSDGWDYEIEVVKEFLATNQSCYCGNITNLGVIHRDDGPCHYPDHKEPEQEPVATFDEVWNSIDWDKWRMEPIRELVKMIHSKTTPPQRKKD